ncbi:hypothetical protein F5144DRAFT_588884 [Chaetomium tenue]|uniref:Uncharacterized protein n=1 Tax=Chaetomium tenue TaxID=1854479 RepID=A0ACB7PQ80_9PEZI|nr:hypothetical protein F5144DRAFT_588884 [Chaetomium globosum]
MVWDTTGAGPNSTFSGNETYPPPNSTFPPWPIPPNAGRSLQPDIIACSVITLLISTVFVGLRFYTRGWVNHVLGAADWCILPALLCAAGVAASALERTDREQAAWYGMLFYNLSLTLSRISILLLYKRIFTYSWIKRAIQIVLILVSAIGIWFIVSVCTACMPLEAFWDWSLFFKGPVYCQPGNLWWANAGLHISSDLVVMALPMPVLSSLNLPQRQKYAIVGVFALGFFTTPINSNSNSGNTLPTPHPYSEPPPVHRHHNHVDHDTLEKSHYYHSFTTMKPSRPDITLSATTPVPTEYDLDHDLDLEAQRTCSLSSTTDCTNTNTTNNNHNHNHNNSNRNSTTTTTTTNGGLDNEAEDRPLRAPPRAHLRLDIRVARTVASQRESWSRSPASSSSPSPGSGLGSGSTGVGGLSPPPQPQPQPGSGTGTGMGGSTSGLRGRRSVFTTAVAGARGAGRVTKTVMGHGYA